MKVRIVNLTKKFFSLRGEIVVLNNISLEIRDKEFFVLLGPSGCGKTTVLNLVAGLDRPNGGEIFFEDMLVASAQRKVFLTPKERNIAFVFQSYALYPHLNVFENIAFPLRIVGTKDHIVKEAVKKAASTLEISNLLLVKPAELSGGQRQRVAIARAIVREPNIFLLDEPLSNLDAQLRIFMRAELKNLQKRLGITTIYVTHDQVEAMSMGDRVALLTKARIEQLGTPQELYENPVNSFVGRFIGTPPMNLFRASLLDESGVYYIMAGRIKLKVSDEKIGALKKIKADHFTLGIRPEHILINPVKPIHPLKAKIRSLEPRGKEVLLHLILDEQRLSALSAYEGFKEDDIVNIDLNLKKSHIFEK